MQTTKRCKNEIANKEALFYEELLKKEINEDRQAHGKKPLKEKMMIRMTMISLHLPEVTRRNSQMIFPRTPKQSKAVPQTRKADGSVRVSIKMYLHTQ